MNYIEIIKEDIPYRFDVELPGGIFTFEINYNQRFDFFTVDLLKNEEVLVYGEKVLLNKILFEDYADSRFPQVNIVARSIGEETEINYNNLGVTVFLAVEG